MTAASTSTQNSIISTTPRATAPPIRALDRYAFDAVNGHLAQYLLGLARRRHWRPGEALQGPAGGTGDGDGPEQGFYPVQPPHR